MEEQSKWDDGNLDLGVKQVTEYTSEELRVAFGALAQKVEQLELNATLFQSLAQQVYGRLQNDVAGLRTDAFTLEKRVDTLDESYRSTLVEVTLHRQSITDHAHMIKQLQSPTDENLAKLAEAVLSVPLDKFAHNVYEAGIFGKVHGIEAQVMAQAEDIEEARADGE
jgi:hypothetical protein